MRWFFTVVIACALSACDFRSDSSSESGEIVTLGGMGSDPVLAKLYYTDRELGVVYSLDLHSGSVERQRSFQSELGDVDADDLGRRLAVAEIGQRRLTVLRLPELSFISSMVLPSDPSQVLWLPGGNVVVATDTGLLDVDPLAGSISTFSTVPSAHTLLTLDPSRQRIYTLERQVVQVGPDGRPIGFDTVVRWFTRDGRRQLVEGGRTKPGMLSGQGLSLDLSWNRSEVFLATNGVSGTYRLDATSLQLLQASFSEPGLRAVAFNQTGTRLYQAMGPSSVTSTELGDSEASSEVFPTSGVTEGNLLLPSDGLNLVMHVESGQIEVLRPFELQLMADPVAPLADPWDLDVIGPPGAVVRIFVATDPGFVYLDPPKVSPRRFLDVDLQSLRPLARTQLGDSGHTRIVFEVPLANLLDDERFILQAVAWLPGEVLGPVSNPLVVHTRKITPKR